MAVIGTIDWEGSRGPRAARAFPDAFVVVSVVLFAASTALTIWWSAAMVALPSCGGDALSMAWQRMPGQTWPAAALSFLAMWTVMMVAMMLPPVVPALWRYREALGERGAALVGAGYFAVWSALGLAVFPLGVALTALETLLPPRGAPIAAGAVLLTAGVLQLTAWKAHQLARCRSVPVCGGAGAGAAWRHGLWLGLHCSASCAGLTAVLLVTGLMDLRAMGLVGAAVAAERLAPAGTPVTRAIGLVIIGAGLLRIARAAGLA